jgi:hypothetical protein
MLGGIADDAAEVTGTIAMPRPIPANASLYPSLEGLSSGVRRKRR